MDLRHFFRYVPSLEQTSALHAVERDLVSALADLKAAEEALKQSPFRVADAEAARDAALAEAKDWKARALQADEALTLERAETESVSRRLVDALQLVKDLQDAAAAALVPGPKESPKAVAKVAPAICKPVQPEVLKTKPPAKKARPAHRRPKK